VVETDRSVGIFKVNPTKGPIPTIRSNGLLTPTQFSGKFHGHGWITFSYRTGFTFDFVGRPRLLHGVANKVEREFLEEKLQFFVTIVSRESFSKDAEEVCNYASDRTEAELSEVQRSSTYRAISRSRI